MRVLIFSHGHPTFSKGGGELAAYYLYQGINETPEHEAWFVGRATEDLIHLGTPIAALNDREYLIAGHASLEHLTATIPLGEESDFAAMLRAVKPDVIHFHHYLFLGVEMIRAAKRICPDARIVITLHEYVAICMQGGLMIKPDGRLCHHYSPRECHLCFPHLKSEDFFLREQYVKSFFKLVDLFISPSEFLKDRYLAWGLNGSRVEVVENGLPQGERVPLRPLRQGEIRGRFAYFGQINPFKGVDLILEAFALLSKEAGKRVSLDIFGSALKNQTQEFQDKIKMLHKKCKAPVRLHGPYEPEEMSRLMAEVDWVIMGSLWWENSPLVIQEAYKFGRPVICPDIGGMAEKVKPGVGGFHYRARDSVSLSSVIHRIVDEPGLFDTVYRALPAYSPIGEATGKHIELYERVRTS